MPPKGFGAGLLVGLFHQFPIIFELDALTPNMKANADYVMVT